MFKLTPTNTKFFDSFDRASDFLVRAATHFLDSIQANREPHLLAEEITTLEDQCDGVAHETLSLLHTSFITPIERSDIRRLIITLDDVLDCLDDAARRIALYEVGPALPDVRSLAMVLVKATKAVQAAVHEVRSLRKSKSIAEHCIEVHRCEDEGDRIYHHALAELFKSNLSPIEIVKWKDIIEDLEDAIDACQDVSLVVEAIRLENS